jgi:multidrug efflux pump subunit AcrB
LDELARRARKGFFSAVWIVLLALRRPYTFVVMAMLITIMGVVSILRMPTDIFPEIDIPVISVVWNYQGLSPEEMELRIVNNYERGLTTTVNDIQRIESQSLQGVSVIKIFFQPGAHIDGATAQITAVSQTFLRQMPPGATPPLIMRYSASNVAIIQTALSSDTLSEQQLFDLGVNFIRPQLTTVQGAQMPWPFGGKQRQVMVDLDLGRLYAWGLSPRDVSNAIAAQSLILPTGSAKIGANEYPIQINSSPEVVADIEAIPIRSVDGKTVYIRDVAHVRDGFAPQTSIVHVGGKKSLLMPILKSGGQSTLDVVSGVKDKLPQAMATAPKELKAQLLFDQSLFVRASVEGVVKEGVIAAGLTGLMILLFLGSFRSTLIVIVSIPLSILVSIIVLAALGQTLNVMTLGGMALAVGILVDDATVEIENIHRNLHKGKPLVRAILDGAQEIAVPAFVSTLSICIVFVPVAFITGSARSLFLPLAMSVVFAMLASYLLSRTLVPTLVRYLLASEFGEGGAEHAEKKGIFAGLFKRFDDAFDAFRALYGRMLAWCLSSRAFVVVAFIAFAGGSMALVPLVGQDFFPNVDAGLIKLHARVPPGTRIEETEHRFAAIEETIQKVVPKDEIDTMVDNMGVPVSGINLSLSDGSLVSTADGEILIGLTHHHKKPTQQYVRELRKALAREHPDTVFYFVAPDISTQVLNFGIAAPIDIQIAGPISNQQKNGELARSLVSRLSKIPGAADVHVHQVLDVPQLRVNVDRTMAGQVGLTQRDVANDMLTSLASSGQVSPSFYLDRKRGVQYIVAVQTPQYKIDSLEALATTPLSTPNGPQLLSNVAEVTRAVAPANITHSDVMPTLDVFMNVDGADLGSVARAVDREVDGMRKDLPRGTTIKVRGQVESMQSSFRGLAYGLAFAIVLVYLLMVVNFQSWLDPFVILMALPGAIAGIVWMLFVSRTTLSVPALMGAIMSVGVATANSILVVTFANQQRAHGRDAVHAALAAGMVRLRPVVMTALAMLIGMLPMSLGVGEGGEQNAPLGRAVIGGLLLATVSTLFFVPIMYSLLRRKAPTDHLTEELR